MSNLLQQSQSPIQVVVNSTGRILLVCLAGAVLAKYKIINANDLKVISKLTEYIFLPSLIITTFIKSVNPYNLQSWLSPLILAIGCFGIGLLLAKIANTFFIKSKHIQPLITISMTTPHTNSLQISLLQSMHDYFDYRYNKPKDIPSLDRGMSYVIIFIMVFLLSRWIFAKNIIENIKHQNEEQLLLAAPAQVSTPKEPLLQRIQSKLTIPVYSLMFGILIVLIPGAKETLTKPQTFLNDVVIHTIQKVGFMTPVSILIVLGASLLAYDTKDSKINLRELTILTIFKLLICSAVGAIIIFIAVKLGLIKDVVLAYIAVITFSTPPGINVLVIATRYGDNSVDVAKILVFTYVVLILTLPLITYIFLLTW